MAHHWGYSSVGRALLLHGRCQRFESAYLHKQKILNEKTWKIYTFNTSQAIKSLRRIPWCSEAMKGVATNEMFRGTGSKFWSENTRIRKLRELLLESNREERANLVNWNILVTRGKESKSDSLSSGERNGTSLNFIFYIEGCGTTYCKDVNVRWSRLNAAP